MRPRTWCGACHGSATRYLNAPRECADTLRQRKQRKTPDLTGRQATAPAEPSSSPRAAAARLDLGRLVAGVREKVLTDIETGEVLLPAVPAVVLELRRLVSDPNFQVRQVTDLLSSDAALAAHVLRLANSAVYGGMPAVADLPRAVMRLGTRALDKSLMLMVMAQMYNAPRGAVVGKLLRELRGHVTHVAGIGIELARAKTNLDPFEVLFAALVHDIGKLPVLAYCATTRGLKNNESLMLALAEQLHVDIGITLLKVWEFSDTLIEVVEEHESVERVLIDEPDLVDVVIVANAISHAGTDHPLAETRWHDVSALRRLSISLDELQAIAEQGRARADAIRRDLE